MTDLISQHQTKFSRYVYTPLPRPDEQIRLLQLHPANALEAPLTGTLQSYLLVEVQNAYEALSYACGDAISPRDFYVNGQALGIGLNLRDALRRLRLVDKPRILWVDAICINQTDLVEKSAQIAMMYRVYGAGRRTVVWLGEDSDERDGEECMRFVEEVTRVEQRGMSLTKVKWWSVFAFYEVCRRWSNSFLINLLTIRLTPTWAVGLRRLLPEYLHNPRSGDLASRYIVSEDRRLRVLPLFSKFLSRQWFTRRWVAQEVMLSSQVALQCGAHHADWEHFRLFVMYRSSGIQLSQATWSMISALARPMGTQPVPSGFPPAYRLLGDLETFAHLDCRDGRDRIAALLGMSLPALESCAMDYAQSVEQNYRQFGETMILNGACATLLHMATLSPRTLDEAHGPLPSWTPDWRQPVVFRRRAESDTTAKAHFDTDGNGERFLLLKVTVLDEIISIQPHEELVPRNVVFQTAQGGRGFAGALASIYATSGRKFSEQRKAFPDSVWMCRNPKPADIICCVVPTQQLQQYLQAGSESPGLALAEEKGGLPWPYELFVLRRCAKTPLEGSTGDRPCWRLVTSCAYDPKRGDQLDDRPSPQWLRIV